MTTLLRTPASSTTGERVPPPAWLGGLGAGLAAALGGLVACMGIAVAGWLTGSSGSVTDALHLGTGAWLLGHGYTLQFGSATIALVPLGLTALLGLVLAGCTAGAIRACRASGLRTQLQLAGAAVGSYVVVVALVTVFSSPSTALGRGAVVTVLLAGCAVSAGAARAQPARALASLPPMLVAVVRGALGGGLALFGCAALVLTASLAVHVESLEQIVGSLQPGLAGGVVLVIACALLLPNAVLLTAAVMLGPGMAVGSGTSVTLTEVALGPLPAIPWLAGIPDAGTQPVALAGLAVMPVLAGIVAGVAAVRRLPAAGVSVAAGIGLAAGLLAGILVGGGIAAAGGSVGPGRMAAFGAPGALCLAVAAGALAVGGLLGGSSVRLLGRPGRLRRALH